MSDPARPKLTIVEGGSQKRARPKRGVIGRAFEVLFRSATLPGPPNIPLHGRRQVVRYTRAAGRLGRYKAPAEDASLVFRLVVEEAGNLIGDGDRVHKAGKRLIH